MSIEFATFIDRICESGLMTRDELETFRQKLPADVRGDDVQTFGRELIRAKKLTGYQVGRILHGRQAGLIIGKNVLLGRIGEGGMGRVYKAEHQTMKRIVALKVISETALRSEQSRKRFLMEVQTAAKLLHPNVVTAYDAGEQNGEPYLVMEFVDGENLRNIVKENGPLSFDKAINYILQAAEGLKYAHSRGVVHRDIKPSNLLLDTQGVVKILDMGLAYVEADMATATDSQLSELTKETNVVGTVEYMAPEQADETNEVDQRSDIYSLGCSLFYLLTGQAPFHRNTPVKTLVAHRIDPIPSLRTFQPDISAQADRLFAKMVAKHADDRYQSAQEVIDAIRQLTEDADFELLDDEPNSDVGDTEYFETGELLVESASGEIERLKSAQKNASPRYDKLTEHAIGIDLGTTFSAISYLDNSGRPITLPNAEGDKLTPSVVLFDEGHVIVGKEAVKAMATDMPMIAECAKRDVGAASFHKIFKGKRFRPEVLLAFVLRKLKTDAEEQIGPIRRAVITVPAYFDEIRRKATQDAGYLAGLEVMDIINEPTSAAVAFGYHLATIQSEQERQVSDRPRRILVYDLGGGTFDVTVMEIRSNVYRTLATDGDVQLGGRDWDERLVDYVAQKFLDRTGDDPRLDANSMGRLLRDCEDAKRTLSAREKATIAVEYEGRAMRVPMTRVLFQELTHDLLARTEFTTRQTLKAANLTWKKIHRILLVGGSTRMPAVSKMLFELSGIKPDRSVAADEAVAHGAAIRAGMLLLQKQGEPMPIKITNVNSHSLGVIGTNPTSGEKQAGVLIPRNTPLPASAQRIFRTLKNNQNSILVQIVEGESSIPKECSTVGKCIVHNLPKKLPARTPITISFQYDENGRLTVSVRVTGIELKQQIMRENSMSNKEMERWRQVIAGEVNLEALISLTRSASEDQPERADFTNPQRQRGPAGKS